MITDLWLMPPHRMHMTTLELAHSRTADDIAGLLATIRPALPKLVNLTFTNRSRLVKPMISYDLSAIAVSFLPAAGDKAVFPLHKQNGTGSGNGNVTSQDSYTYHHLRRDVYDLAQSTGVEIGSRYVVPSAHITLGRYLTHKDHDTPEKREAWVRAIDDINTWLEHEVWELNDGNFVGEWFVGEERGLDARAGTLWYGGGRTIMVGEGF